MPPIQLTGKFLVYISKFLDPECSRCSLCHYSCRSSSVRDIRWFRLQKIAGINKPVRRWGGGEEGCRQTWLQLLTAWLSDRQEGSTDSLYEAVQSCSAGTPPPVPSRSCSVALVLEDTAPDPGRLISTVRRSMNQSRPFACKKPADYGNIIIRLIWQLQLKSAVLIQDNLLPPHTLSFSLISIKEISKNINYHCV